MSWRTTVDATIGLTPAACANSRVPSRGVDYGTTCALRGPFAHLLWLDAGLTTVLALAFGGGPRLVSQATSTDGEAMPWLQVEYVSLDPGIVTVDRWSGRARPIRDGRARMVARTFAYGVTQVDTVTYTVVPPYGRTVLVDQAGTGIAMPLPIGDKVTDLIIRTGGVVFWMGHPTAVTNIVFDNPTDVAAPSAELCAAALNNFLPPNCASGNVTIDPAVGEFTALRYFPIPGVYSYRMAQFGLTGQMFCDKKRPDRRTEAPARWRYNTVVALLHGSIGRPWPPCEHKIAIAL